MSCRRTLSGPKRPYPNGTSAPRKVAFAARAFFWTTFASPTNRTPARDRLGLICQYLCELDIKISLAAR